MTQLRTSPLHSDFAVEIPLHVSKRGIEGIQTQELPLAVISHILSDRVATVTLEIEAFRTGSRERLRELLMLDPWTRSIDQADALLTDILAMPENASMRAHFTN